MKSYIIVFFSLLISIASEGQGNNGLVAHWNFNGNANDVSGHNLNGVVSGATLTAGYNGIANTAYHFNGSGNHIDIAYNNLLDLDSFSICALIKPLGFYSGTCQDNKILMKGDDGGDPQTYSLAFLDNPYDGDCGVFSPAHEVFAGNAHNNSTAPPEPSFLNSNTPLVDSGVWYCATITYGSDSLKIYVNGVHTLSLLWTDTYAPGNGDLGIGYMATGVSNGYPYWFNGVIDDIRLYRRPLSVAEVVQYCDTAKMLPPTSVLPISSLTPEIIVAPNPAHNYVDVSLPGNGSTNYIQLLNTTGQVINEFKSDNGNVSLDISMLSAGLYFLRAEYNGQAIFKKIIKK